MEDQKLYDAFTELGSDPKMSDIGFALEAQAEVALSDYEFVAIGAMVIITGSI
jgi:hypothetical protein